jgi:DNA-binding SARP family transcriptional activator
VARADLAALLWDRASDAAARTNLRRALRELSSAFGALAKNLISIERDSIKLNTRAFWIDALAVLALDPSAPAAPAVDLNALCRGELLAGLDGASASFDRWLLGERTRVTGRLQSLLERETEQAESKPVGWQVVEVVVVQEEVGGLASADGSDLVTVRYERLTRGVTMPPHDALLAPALTEVGSG